MSTQASLVFVHIHKTAGSSITESLSRLFDPTDVHDHLDLSSVTPSRWPGLIASHAHYPALEALDGDKIFVTCLRRPADRLLSLYNFWHSVRHETAVNIGSAIVLEARRCSFAEFICSENEHLQTYLDNEMTRAFSTAGREVTEADFQTACTNIEKIDSILMFETLNEDFERLLNQLGCASQFRPLVRINTTAENGKCSPDHFEAAARASLSDLPPEAMEHLFRRTYFDRRLYDFARSSREAKNQRRSIAGADRLRFRRTRLCRGDIIQPTDNEAFASLLGDGWALDRTPQWSVGRRTFLHFKVTGGTGDRAFVDIHFGALLVPNRPSIVIEVRVDNGEWRRVLFVSDMQIDLRETRFDKVTDICAGTNRTWKMMAPLDADPDEDRVHTIEFRNEGVSTPALLGYNADQRDLSVRLEQFAIM